MTTIATDGKTMAADSQQSTYGVDNISCIKLHRIGDYVYSHAGNLSEALIYLDWVKAGCPDDNRPVLSDECSFVKVGKGKVFRIINTLRPYECGFPFAMGSGAEYAMGAMAMGATPIQAVKIAMKYDIYTGGKVRTMKC